ncbi:MAG: matrixin family metalloprotease [Candidatus Paceibacterota bacterium]
MKWPKISIEAGKNDIIATMHRIGTYILIGVLTIATISGLSSSRLFAGPCTQPILYRIGVIDDRFGIATSTVMNLLQEAENVWEEPIDRELFTYDENADFTVNFEFDHRQQTTETANSYEDTLSNLEASHSEIINAYKEASSAYDARLSSYEDNLDAYEADLEAYNQTVREWNERGGAPKDVREELVTEQEQLRQQLQQLESQQQDLEVLREQVNELADRGNVVADEYNQTATTFSQRFGSPQEFSQATYTGDMINVYQFEGHDDLKLAMVHEFGHALGIGHVSSTDSVMYYLMEDQSLDDVELSQEDIAALYNVCDIDA